MFLEVEYTFGKQSQKEMYTAAQSAAEQTHNGTTVTVSAESTLDSSHFCGAPFLIVILLF